MYDWMDCEPKNSKVFVCCYCYPFRSEIRAKKTKSNGNRVILTCLDIIFHFFAFIYKHVIYQAYRRKVSAAFSVLQSILQNGNTMPTTTFYNCFAKRTRSSLSVCLLLFLFICCLYTKNMHKIYISTCSSARWRPFELHSFPIEFQ